MKKANKLGKSKSSSKLKFFKKFFNYSSNKSLIILFSYFNILFLIVIVYLAYRYTGQRQQLIQLQIQLESNKEVTIEDFQAFESSEDDQPEARPRYDATVEYSVIPQNQNESLLKSEQLGFEVTIPSDTSVNEGGYYERSKPKEAYKSLSITFPRAQGESDLTISLSVGNTVYKESLLEIAKAEAKLCETLPSKPGETGCPFEIKETVLNGNPALVYFHESVYFEGDIYWLENEGKWYRITIYNYGGGATQERLSKAHKIVDSLKLI